MKKKRHHHYVWKKYLEPWTADGQIWCLMNGEIFPTNPKHIGQARDFYNLKELSDEDIAFVQKDDRTLPSCDRGRRAATTRCARRLSFVRTAAMRF